MAEPSASPGESRSEQAGVLRRWVRPEPRAFGAAGDSASVRCGCGGGVRMTSRCGISIRTGLSGRPWAAERSACSTRAAIRYSFADRALMWVRTS